MQNKKHSPWKKSTKSTLAHQKKVSHRKKTQKSTMVLLKALTMIPVFVGLHYLPILRNEISKKKKKKKLVWRQIGENSPN